MGGHSAAAGHGNNFHQQYTMQFANIMGKSCWIKHFVVKFILSTSIDILVNNSIVLMFFFAKLYLPMQMLRLPHIEPVFHKLGMRLIARNLAMGGLGTLHYSFGSSTLYGETDFLMWGTFFIST